jgi:hypothetical protein
VLGELQAAAVVETVAALTPTAPARAIGHSFGGMVLAASVAASRPELAVNVDAPLQSHSGNDRAELIAEYEQEREQRTAAEQLDPEIAAAVADASGGTWVLTPGSILIRADPSHYVSDRAVVELQDCGVDLRSIPGAAHSVLVQPLRRVRQSASRGVRLRRTRIALEVITPLPSPSAHRLRGGSHRASARPAVP